MDAKPVGRETVIAALTAATTELILEKGPTVSVREIAARAGVNHGLVHRHFAGKDALIQAALDGINERAGRDIGVDGFPPPDLASRRDGELAKVMALVRIEAQDNPFSTHPVSVPWRSALQRADPDLGDQAIDTMIASSTALALGWALFGDQLAAILGIDDARRGELDEFMFDLVAELGGMPKRDVDR